MKKVKVGIIICGRYSACAGGKCFRALKNREGAFERYRDKDAEGNKVNIVNRISQGRI